MVEDSLWKDVDIRITDQRIGMGIGGYDTIMRIEHKPTRIVVEIPSRVFGGGQHKTRQIALEMIEYALTNNWSVDK